MIGKTGTKSLYYLDRDTDIMELVDEMMRVKRSEAIVFLKREQEKLQEKDAGSYRTIEYSLKTKDGELENMQRFFRGAVVPYYVRQHYGIWSQRVPSKAISDGTDEIKRLVGFMIYDHTGHQTEDVNSMTTFQRVKDLNQFLKEVEAVCFEDNGYIYPDSKHFKQLEKDKGRIAAQRQVFLELKQATKNKHYKGEII